MTRTATRSLADTGHGSEAGLRTRDLCKQRSQSLSRDMILHSRDAPHSLSLSPLARQDTRTLALDLAGAAAAAGLREGGSAEFRSQVTNKSSRLQSGKRFAREAWGDTCKSPGKADSRAGKQRQSQESRPPAPADQRLTFTLSCESRGETRNPRQQERRSLPLPLTRLDSHARTPDVSLSHSRKQTRGTG